MIELMSPTGRRAEYAEQTRLAILDAARSLFLTQGYYATKVEQIASTARVAPATVYAVGGGKNGLLRTLIESAVHSPENAGLLDGIRAATDPATLIGLVVKLISDLLYVLVDPRVQFASVAR